jgi:hypothetical protein
VKISLNEAARAADATRAQKVWPPASPG